MLITVQMKKPRRTRQVAMDISASLVTSIDYFARDDKYHKARATFRLRPVHLRQFPLWINDEHAIFSRLRDLILMWPTTTIRPKLGEVPNISDVEDTNGCFTSRFWWNSGDGRIEDKISNSIPLESLTLISIQLGQRPLFFLHEANLHSIAIDSYLWGEGDQMETSDDSSDEEQPPSPVDSIELFFRHTL